MDKPQRTQGMAVPFRGSGRWDKLRLGLGVFDNLGDTQGRSLGGLWVSGSGAHESGTGESQGHKHNGWRFVQKRIGEGGSFIRVPREGRGDAKGAPGLQVEVRGQWDEAAALTGQQCRAQHHLVVAHEPDCQEPSG